MGNTEKRLQEWLGEDNQLGIDIWHKKYQHNDESFDEWLDRVSAGDEDIKEEIEAKRFLFGGRILANRGLHKEGVKVTYSNCYVLPAPEDNIESIYDTASKLARTFSYGGGVGIDISKLAPKGARVNNTAKETSGAVSFMDLYGMTTGLIGQNGRRGALMISMDCHHPDLEEFIKLKSDLDKVTTANISIRMDDDFMRAVEDGKDVTLFYNRPEVGQTIEKTINAKEVFDEIAFQNWDMGEPGVLFWDNIRNWNLLSNDDNFEYAGTNPCLTGDTIVAVADGRNGVAIKDLCNTTFPVYSARMSRSNGGNSVKGDKWVTEVKTAKAFKSGTKKIITIRLSDGSEFRCTPDHRLALADGSYAEAQYCLGKQLGKFFTFSDKNTHKSYRHINSFTYNKQYKYIALYYHLLDKMTHTVHHLDGDSTNDLPENLGSMSFTDHMADVSACRKIDNPITRDINYEYNQGLRNITANGKRYGWSQERIDAEKAYYAQTHQHLYTEKVDQNCYLNDIVTVTAIIDNGEVEDVYDLSVEDNHNFYIITNTDDDKYLNCSGVLVHNCAEEPLPAGGSCLLGSINLSEFVCDPYTEKPEFDMATYRITIRRAVRALNDVLDEGLPLHPLQIQRDTVRDWRQIGLGIFGIADMLVKMGLDYGSEKARKFCVIIAKALASTAISESNRLARKFGAYPKYTNKVFDTPYIEHIYNEEDRRLLAIMGLRNSQLLTIAPTGTLSTMLGVSGGIEPFFATEWERTTKSLHGEDVVYKEHPRTIEELLKAQGTDIIPNYVVTSGSIKPIDRIKMQAVWQKYIDASISSTINLPNDTTPEEVAEIYMQAWKHGLKGVTVFRDGCRRVAILNAPTKDENGQLDDEGIKEGMKDLTNQLGRGDILAVCDDLLSSKRTLVNGCGKMYLHLDFDEMTGEPLETWIECGSGGGCERNLAFISRLMSLALRGGIDIRDIIDQAMSIKPCKAYCDRTKLKHDTSRGTSCPQSIGYAMEELYHKIQDRCFVDDDGYDIEVPMDIEEIDDETEISNDLDFQNPVCPECGEQLFMEGGCVICKSCGWSRCD